MDTDLQKYYENRFELFNSKGWTDLIEDLKLRMDSISSIKGVKDIETLNLRKGELDVIEWLVGLPEQTRNAYDGEGGYEKIRED